MLRRSPFYYYCTFPDQSAGEVCLKPGELWSFQSEDTSDGDDTNSDATRNDDMEEVTADKENDAHDILEVQTDEVPDLIPIENEKEKDETIERIITPDTSTHESVSPELKLLPDALPSSAPPSMSGSDGFIDESYADQLELTLQNYEDAATVPELEKAFSLFHPHLSLPADMSIEENRVYNLTSALNLDIPLDGTFAAEKTYLIPEQLSYHLVYRRNPYIDHLSPSFEKKQKFRFLPKFVRRLNPFRKKKT